ncbi:MAG: DUF2490 domain-containing protein [Candidatus Pseudobacter hemicellulosilyticus]|uniref:DUF2490 domain-containing protein n=1 Tax=Candidatus Pseudobacter hemicellulosilyticus TaxID=3121375 RepID=A0AAJ5WVG3_9BACT|nr:MAG: DUF2490 domain-containing protein [Pseudobacter sp.]
MSCLPILAFSQTQFTGWVAAFNTFKLNKDLSIHFDAQVRGTDQVQQIQSILLRPGLNWHTGKRTILTTGYAYVQNRRTISGISGLAPEHRIWQQFIYNHPLTIGSGAAARKGSFQHRLRLEQRFISKSFADGHELTHDGNVYANRIRYFFRNVTPIVPWSATGTGPFLGLQNELFINFGDKSVVNGETFDQNRAYAALGYRLHTRFDAEIGYMNQYVNGRNKAFTNNHILQLAAYVRL